MSDLYPRQQMGLVVMLFGVLGVVVCVVDGVVPTGFSLWSFSLFFVGLGCGMLSGNTRTKRVLGNRRPR